jgi:hypothetical protein
MLRKILFAVIVFSAMGAAGRVSAEDVYYYVRVSEVNITRGELPRGDEKTDMERGGWRRRLERMRYMSPYAVGNAGEEMYVMYVATYVATENPRMPVGWGGAAAAGRNIGNNHLAVRAAKGNAPSGRLFFPKADWSGMMWINFTVGNPAPDQNMAREEFLKAKKYYYEGLLDMGIPGAAWYRHQASEARGGKDSNSADSEAQRRRGMMQFSRGMQGSQLERSYSLFSGGRAISENLQLDRELGVLKTSEQTIPLESIEGITTTAIQWKDIVNEMAPKKDALAGLIPADQHVIFFPSFKAMAVLTDEARARGTPVLRMLDSRSEDVQTQERYERQLCLSMDKLSRALGPALVLSVAFTGSDPYLRTGSDVAVLFEAASPEALRTMIAGRHLAAVSSFAGAQAVSGKVQDVNYSGVVSPGRELCSYMATVADVVMVTNSLYQLERLVKTAKGQVSSIASADEYTFFRDRYKVGDVNETALVVLTDAAIRRWCSPRWRIGCSRRTRVAAALAELQCRYLDELAGGKVKDVAVAQSIPGAGEIRLMSSGIRSSVYGTPEFLTPIAEIPLDKVTSEEKSAYENFRANYQRGWRRFFDPIAVRLSVDRDYLRADMTVRPLILESDYREFMNIAKGSRITGDAGDPHEEALLHFILSVDPNSERLRQMGSFAMPMSPETEVDKFGWIGKWVTAYADEDSFWQELEKATADGGADKARRFMEKNFMRLPVVVHCDVSNPLKLAAFLVSARAFVEQSSPGLTVWETLKHNEQPYVKVSAAPGSEGLPEDFNGAALYYAPTSRSLVVTLNEQLMKRSLDRMAKRHGAAGDANETTGKAETWLGKSVAVKAKKEAIAILQGLFQENVNSIMETRAWGNIPILNEWKRRYPDVSAVEFHNRFWQTKLVCPGGGEYVWNEEYQTMESTVYGHPGQPRAVKKTPNSPFDFTGVDLGLTFEGDGLRAKTALRRGTGAN